MLMMELPLELLPSSTLAAAMETVVMDSTDEAPPFLMASFSSFTLISTALKLILKTPLKIGIY